MYFYHVFFIIFSLFSSTNAFSSCDDVDITFLVDTDSIINYAEAIEDFIKLILWDGSSEYAGFSVVLYGDNIPISQDINMINLEETECIHQRQAEEIAIINKLQLLFDAISDYSPDQPVKSVSLSEAFNVASNQNKPVRNNNKQQKLHNSGVGMRDNEQEYFIFDYSNKLLSDNNNNNDNNNTNDDLCELLYHNKYNDDETLHFLMGQDFYKLHIRCNGEDALFDNLLNKRTFFRFNEDLFDNKMEIIYDITCPAIVDTSNGKLDLGNHNQWIDPNTILECELIIVDNNNKPETPLKLESDSYILVKDFINDDNTFKKNDFLIASPNVEQQIKDLGCWSPIYRINDIEKVSDGIDFQILKLRVQLPKSPTDYILTSNVAGQSDVNYDNSKRNLLSFLELTGSGSHTFFDTGDYPDIFHNEWTYSKTKTTTQTAGTKPKFTFTGTGTMTLKTGFDISVKIYVDFDFVWDVLSNDIYIKFVLNIDWGLTAWFNAELVGNVVAKITDLINYSKYITFSIGVVPVIIKPFITLNAKLTSLPLRVFSGINCHYGELLQVGYEYDKKTIFNAEYGTIRSNYRYKLPVVKTWNNVAKDTCVRQNYEYGAGAGLSCVWFDYNTNSGKCRCYGAGAMMGDITSESGTTAYIMNKECGSEYHHTCDGCGTDIWVKEDGNKYSCTGLCCCKGSPIPLPYSCKKTCTCVPGWYNWYCKSCPLFQSNSGYETTSIKQAPIKSRTAHSNNGCTKTFEIGSEEENQAACPVTQLGFDIEVTAKIGANLYSLVTAYGEAVLTIPFRITLPELNNAICSNAAESCDNTLQASFTIQCDLALNMGYAVDFGDLGTIVQQAVDGSKATIGDISAITGIVIPIGNYQIIPLTTIACLPLNGGLAPLNTYYKSKCCTPTTTDGSEGASGTCCACIEPSTQSHCPADIICESKICAADSYCCNTRWDSICSQAASNICEDK